MLADGFSAAIMLIMLSVGAPDSMPNPGQYPDIQQQMLVVPAPKTDKDVSWLVPVVVAAIGAAGGIGAAYVGMKKKVN